MRRLAVALAMLVAHAARAGSLPPRPGMYTKAQAALPMVASTLDVTLHGPIAEVDIAQTFRNDDAAPTEATYIFPLPDDAAVTAMAIDVGARQIRAAIERRAAAKARYEDAIAKGLDAGLVDEARPDVFAESVAAIPPHATVTVHLRFDTAARFASGTWQLVLPLVVAPRYVPGRANGQPTVGTGRSPDTDRAPDASRVTPPVAPGAGGPTTIAIAFDGPVDDVTSPTHDLTRDLAQQGEGYVIADPHGDRDAVIRWHARDPARGWVESDGAAAIVVEAPPAPATRPPARATFAFDRSATTLGDAALVERGLETAFVRALGPSDGAATERGRFGSAADLGAALARAPEHEPFDLAQVLGHIHPSGAPVVLVTAGLVADDAAAVAAARALGVPVHVIGFGPAPNHNLLRAIAAATGGTLREAVVADDLPALANAVLADVASPPAPLTVTWGTLVARQIAPAVQPRLGAGQAELVFARVAEAAHRSAANARAAGAVIALAAFVPPAPPAGATTAMGPIGRMWARLELDELVAAGDADAIAAHALAYGLVSPETAMVAVGAEVTTAGGVRRTHAVPVSLPAGMRWQDVERETTVDTLAPTGQTITRDNKAPAPVTTAPLAAPPAPTVATGAAAETEAEDEDQAVDLHARITSYRTPSWRLSASLGGGVVVAHDAATGAGALALRADYGRALRGGVEGSLWLVGTRAEGRLGLFAGYAFGRFELDLGGDLHLGGGIGPAGNLALRVSLLPYLRHLPAHRLDAFLREDLGVDFANGTHFGTSATTAGLEFTW